MLPGAKVSRRSPRSAASRGVDCISPSRHAEFTDADSLLDLVELLADETGLPVGIKSAVGDMAFWEELTDLMARTGAASTSSPSTAARAAPAPPR